MHVSPKNNATQTGHTVRRDMNKFGTTIAAFLLLCLMAAPAFAEKPSKSVLYLNSYHHGYRWSDSIMDGVRSVLDGSRYKIDLQIEYMDAKRYNYKDVTGMLVRLYKEKFVHEHFDIIIASDNDAFFFATQYRNLLFPGVPLVFCGVNALEPKSLIQGNLTGVVEQFDLSRTLDVVLNMHPGKKHMIVVGDSSTAGVAIKHQIENVVPQYSQRLTVDYWIDISLNTVLDRVEKLPNKKLAFLNSVDYIVDCFLADSSVMNIARARSSAG